MKFWRPAAQPSWRGYRPRTASLHPAAHRAGNGAHPHRLDLSKSRSHRTRKAPASSHLLCGPGHACDLPVLKVHEPLNAIVERPLNCVRSVHCACCRGRVRRQRANPSALPPHSLPRAASRIANPVQSSPGRVQRARPQHHPVQGALGQVDVRQLLRGHAGCPTQVTYRAT